MKLRPVGAQLHGFCFLIGMVESDQKNHREKSMQIRIYFLANQWLNLLRLA